MNITEQIDPLKDFAKHCKTAFAPDMCEEFKWYQECSESV